MESSSFAGVPILLGVTGHQDIDPALHEPLRDSVRAVFRQLRSEYPSSPLVLLSPLVSGADQLVADVVLDLSSNADANVQVVAVLPWPKEWDVDDSSHWGDRATFDRLVSQADQVVTLPLSGSVTEKAIHNDPTARNAQRNKGGQHIARHSQILIALWDGVESSGSHTSQVVDWQRCGAPAPFAAKVGELDVSEGAAVCHLPVRRISDAEAGDVMVGSVEPQWSYPEDEDSIYVREWPEKKAWYHKGWFVVRSILKAVHDTQHAFAWWRHDRTPKGERRMRDRWKAIDRFNRDTAKLPAMAADKLSESRGYLIPKKLTEELPECVRKLREVYALADTSAGVYQNRIWWIVLALFGMGFTAVASLEIYAHYWHEWPLPLLYLALLSVAYALFRWSRSQQHQGRWLDDRALAEALRVQVFWRWAGLDVCVGDHYLRHFRGQLDWIRHATRAVYLISGGHTEERPLPASEQRDRFEMVCKYWIDDQHGYFKGKAPVNEELATCFEMAAKLFFYAAIGVTVCLIWHHLQTHHMSHALVLATFGCLITAALLEEFAEIQTYTLLGRRYGWMTDLFGNALNRMKALTDGTADSQDLDRIDAVIFDLGREALAENADWVVQHRQRPPVLPKG